MPAPIPPKGKNIVVIGAGITGLQTSLALLSAGYSVTILAQHFPGDEDVGEREGEGGGWASPWAGAHWRTHASSQDERERAWDVETYESWMGDVKVGRREGEGLGIYDSHLYWPSPAPPSAADTWWSPHVQSFTHLPTSSLPTSTSTSSVQPTNPITSGISFKTITIDVPTHLSALLSLILSRGGNLFRDTLPTDRGLASALTHASTLVPSSDIYAFVNATGLGARALVPDDKMYPVRGQTILVRGEAERVSTLEGISSIRYVIPRKGSGTSVLGGTKEVGRWGTEPDEQVTRDILEGCRGLAPELLTGEEGGFEVLRVQVGLRPCRMGGARVEKEVVGGWRVVHSYGHAGAGYQNSVGCAREVLRLVRGFEEEGGGVGVAKLSGERTLWGLSQ